MTTGISIKEIVELVDKIRALKKIVIFDACREFKSELKGSNNFGSDFENVKLF